MAAVEWRRTAQIGVLLLAVFISGSLGYLRAQAVQRQSRLEEARRWLEGRVIVVDPGHGGWDPGAVANGTEEKGLVLAIALVVKQMLEEQGATVVLTRETDTHFARVIRQDLAQRVALAEQHNAHAFVSIHANKDRCNCWGAQSFYHKGEESGKQLAEAIQGQMRRLTPTTREALPGNFYVLRNTTAPGTIVEVGFLSDSREAKRLQNPDYQRTLAEAITLGLADFFRSQVPQAQASGELGE